MPDQCQSGNYNTLSEATRSTNNSVRVFYCDSKKFKNNLSPSWQGPGWYKFANPAGTKMATEPPPVNTCGTHVTGWMTTEPPSEIGQTKSVKFCFNWAGNSCKWNIFGEVTKCGEGDFVSNCLMLHVVT